MKLASATLWHFFSPWFKSAPSIRWVDRRDAQESFLTLLLITNSQKKKGHESKFSTRPRILQVQTECTEEIWMYRMEFPHFCSPKDCGAFFGALNKKKNDNDDKNTADSISPLQPIFSLKKKSRIFLNFICILFLCVDGAAQPVAAAAADDSSTAGPRGSKGTALKVTKRFFWRESKLLVWEVLYQLSISTSHTSLCLSSSPPREPVEDTLVGFVFFFFLIQRRPSNTKQNNLSVRLRLSLSLSAFLAKRVR